MLSFSTTSLPATSCILSSKVPFHESPPLHKNLFFCCIARVSFQLAEDVRKMSEGFENKGLLFKNILLLKSFNNKIFLIIS